MIKKQFAERVLENRLIAENTYLMRLTCAEEVIRLFRPGQFAHIEIPNAGELLLRRPISINYVDSAKKEVHLAYNVVGKGTERLSYVHPNDVIDVLMPLGNGFQLTDSMKKVWLVGGGIGIAPLKSLTCKYPDREYTAFLGYRSKSCVYEVKDLEAFAKTYVTTDDGSYCRKGFCTDVLLEEIEKSGAPDVILACGPHLFFRSLARVVEKIGGIPAFVSLEQRMGCGTGGCATCVCKVGGKHKKVCLQGPVFPIREVDSLYD